MAPWAEVSLEHTLPLLRPTLFLVTVLGTIGHSRCSTRSMS